MIAFYLLKVLFQIVIELLWWVGPIASIYLGFHFMKTVQYPSIAVWLIIIGGIVLLYKIFD